MKKVLFASAALLMTVAVATPAFAEDPTTSSKGSIKLIQNPGGDGEDEEEEKPGNNGPLTIRKTSLIDFGEQYISGSDTTYSAMHLEDGRPNYVQVKDNRGTNAGWTLQVSNTQFTDKADNKNVLTGSVLSIKGLNLKKSIPNKETGKIPTPEVEEAMTAESIASGWLLKNVELDGSNSPIALATAKVDNGMGYTNIYFGNPGAKDDSKDQSKKNKDVQLTVLGTTKKKDTATYESTITWTLLAEPTTAK